MIESRWLMEMYREKEKGAVQKFERFVLLPFPFFFSRLTLIRRLHSIVRMLNGRHHLDEIRFRAQLSRKHLAAVLAAFDEHLILFSHA
jgi:hypothetical protein